MSLEKLEGTPFVVKLYQILADEQNSTFSSWNDSGSSFVIWNPVEFGKNVLPRYFKHNNFCSFVRQLNTYGFVKVESPNWEFRNDLFQKDKPGLLKDILRRKSKKREVGGSLEEEEEIKEEQVIIKRKTSNSPDLPKQVHSLQPTPPMQPVQQPLQQPLQQSLQFHQLLQECQIPPTAKDSREEIDNLHGMNNLLMKEVIRLQRQQESTASVVKQLLYEVSESKKQILNLNIRINQLTINNAIQELKQPTVATPSSSLTPPPLETISNPPDSFDSLLNSLPESYSELFQFQNDWQQ